MEQAHGRRRPPSLVVCVVLMKISRRGMSPGCTSCWPRLAGRVVLSLIDGIRSILDGSTGSNGDLRACVAGLDLSTRRLIPDDARSPPSPYSCRPIGRQHPANGAAAANLSTTNAHFSTLHIHTGGAGLTGLGAQRLHRPPTDLRVVSFDRPRRVAGTGEQARRVLPHVEA
jgi:hypothetical protein